MGTCQRLVAALVWAAVIGSVTVGCAPEKDTATRTALPSATAEALSSSSSPSSEAVLALFAGISYDYDPYEDPEDLSQVSAFVVEGTVTEYNAGRRLVATGTDRQTGETVVITLSDVVSVDGAPIERGEIYVELGPPAPEMSDKYAQAMPPGTRVLLYLNEAWDGANAGDESLANPDAGRPADEPLYAPNSPQSFIVQAQSEVVWPLLGEGRKGTLSEAAPGGDVWAE